MSVDTVIMGGNMKGPEENIGDGRVQCHARVTKVLGIVQFVLGVAVICATRVAEVRGSREQGLLRKKRLPTFCLETYCFRDITPFERLL